MTLSTLSQKQSPGKPPCSAWGLWYGKEIEGTDALGVYTLFVRAPYSLASILACKEVTEAAHSLGLKEFPRIWLCKDYIGWATLSSEDSRIAAYQAALRGIKVLLEVTPDNFAHAQHWRQFATFYMKGFPLPELRQGDHICLGSAYSDTAFVIGNAVTVNPAQYLADTEISHVTINRKL